MKYSLAFLSLILIASAYAQDTPVLSISGVEVQHNQIEKVSGSSRLNHTVDLKDFEVSDVLSAPNPSPEAVALYRYIQDMFGKKTLSGQMWAPWGINEIDYVQNATGLKPAIAGFDYINEPSNALENQRAINYWNDGGISTMMWHWGAPGVGEGYENSKATIDIDQCFIEGTPEYEDFWGDLKRIGDWLQKLEDANVPVLWRPLHELNGNWFWWSKGGSSQFKRIWITMYDYLVHERELNNLIWVLCYTGDPNGAWFPGDEYVDIAGADTYDNTTDAHLTMFNDVLESVGGNNYPVTFHETGNPPDPEDCIRTGAMWSWWMIWHTDWLTGVDENYLRNTYQSHLVITLDELPDIKNDYGWDAECAPSKITASIRPGESADWYETNKIGVDDGSGSITFRVDTDDTGTWKWSGYGTAGAADGSDTERTVPLNGLGTATATFTNECGAITTQTFHVVDDVLIRGVLATRPETGTVSVFPSPTSDILKIRFRNPDSISGARTTVYNQEGRLMLEQRSKGEGTTLNISSLPRGIYLVVVEQQESRSVVKIIKD
ncbi:glycosyl hydrolase [Marinoscillum sp. 108]|uniref:glycosyl hydrolase n=1 Tax=Marinoscillum sp. 108 TaxID=2653151 RepID=UPI0012F14695|nr:glycosyl hydrolase [Marinoscillum sp. 108]VXD11561.1 Glycosyl hydrolase family 26 [Marinoscillum sp. 108]